MGQPSVFVVEELSGLPAAVIEVSELSVLLVGLTGALAVADVVVVISSQLLLVAHIWSDRQHPPPNDAGHDWNPVVHDLGD